MAGIEDVPQLEGMWAPLDVRCELRQMFRRWLPTTNHLRPSFGLVELLDEIQLLDFCQHYRLEYFGAAKDIAKIWDESKERIADEGPTFSDLTRLGWIVFDGGRLIMQCSHLGTFSHITYPSPSTQKFLHDLSKIKLVEKTSNFTQGAQKQAVKILDEQLLERYIPTNRPDWLAGQIDACPLLAGKIRYAPLALKQINIWTGACWGLGMEAGKCAFSNDKYEASRRGDWKNKAASINSLEQEVTNFIDTGPPKNAYYSSWDSLHRTINDWSSNDVGMKKTFAEVVNK